VTRWRAGPHVDVSWLARRGSCATYRRQQLFIIAAVGFQPSNARSDGQKNSNGVATLCRYSHCNLAIPKNPRARADHTEHRTAQGKKQCGTFFCIDIAAALIYILMHYMDLILLSDFLQVLYSARKLSTKNYYFSKHILFYTIYLLQEHKLNPSNYSKHKIIMRIFCTSYYV
jgi:hypothetical protein